MQRTIKNNTLANKLMLGLLSCFIWTASHAAGPLWTVMPAPGSNPTQTVPESSTSFIQYIVQNQSGKPKKLVIQPMPGITQTTPCQLAPKGQVGSSCTLNLSIIGSALPQGGVHGGPALCLANPDGSPNLLQCYQPSAVHILNITKGSAEIAALAVSPPALDLVAGSGTPGFLTITNNSSVITAQNVQATLPASWTDVTQDASNCVAIAPNGGSCQLQFTPGAATHALETIPISGNNTTQVSAQIAVNAPAQASLAVSGAPLVLSPNCGTGSTLTVTNTSTTTAAENLSIDLGDLTDNVQINNDSCTGSDLAANGGQCTFELQGTSAAAADTITVEADNAPAVSSSVEVRQLAVNDTYQQGIVFVVDNCNNGKTAARQDSQDASSSFLIVWGGFNGGGAGCISTNATDINNGATNTATIFNVLTTTNMIAANTYAAGICYQYTVNADSNSPCTGNPGETCYSNWYLPAEGELNDLWQQTTFNGRTIAGFDSLFYWSSTEVGACAARAQFFSNGFRDFDSKGNKNRVRCVRAFTPSTL
ncbi:DUF1566 domain-containing protein [Legionella yabuuchiae]|uniref:DUF1566 domain-containing protein n=1 Tax=Legionella yabuuchiae TaxID=376727 RepID=UPI0010563B64|nr:DUF1566 domain-containing protein [Legionella yabuuchiae]